MNLLLRTIFSRKALIAAGCVVTLLGALLAAFHAFENWRGRRDWNAYRAAAEARGVKLGLDALQTAPIPDAENFAAIPLFEEIFRAQRAGEPIPEPLNLPKHSPREAGADKSRRVRKDLAVLRDAFVKEAALEDAEEDPARAVLRAMERYEPILTQLREASRRPKTRFPVQWERGFGAAVPHYGVLQKTAAAFGTRCAAHLGVGDTAAALADIQDGLRLYRAIEKEPSLIAGLVRISVLAILEDAVWDGLAGNHWSATSLQALESEFVGLRLIEDYRLAIQTERASMNVGLDRFSGSSSRQRVVMIGIPDDSVNATALFLSACFPRGLFLQNQRLINELFDEKVARIDRRPRPWMEPDGASDRLHVIAHSTVQRYYYCIVVLAMPALEHLESRYLEAHTRAQQTHIACALARYRQALGTYPESLDALVPEFLPTLPTDIMDDAPLRYRRMVDGSYEMWSIGENRIDDLAAIDPTKRWNKQADWIWKP